MLKQPDKQELASHAQTIRFGADDIAILSAVQEEMGLVRRVDALRYVLRQYAKSHQKKRSQ